MSSTLEGQTVVLIGGSSGIGLETARRARAEGAQLVLTGRNRDRLEKAAHEVGARETAAFDATDAAAVKKFFEENFARFVDGLPPELLETAALTPEVYADVCRFLSGSNAEKLSDRLKMWVSFHHVRLGSEKFHLLLIPRDAFFHLAASEEEKLRRDYINHIDNYSNASSTVSPKPDIIDHDLGGFEWTRAFERIPVRNQVYDILVYAHRAHGSSTSMVFETRRIGMVSCC